MKNIIKSIRITLAFCILLGIGYVGVLWVFGQFFSRGEAGNAAVVTLNGQVVGGENIGQNFTQDIYFWGRPSAVNHTADASGASNKAPLNEEYLDQVEARIDTFLVHHPYLERKDVPAEMVTASGSGLDPHISSQSAFVQIKRIAQARHISPEEVRQIVEQQIEKPFLGIFGTEKINVLKLNVALDEAANK